MGACCPDTGFACARRGAVTRIRKEVFLRGFDESARRLRVFLGQDVSFCNFQVKFILFFGHQALSRIEQGKMAPKMDHLPRMAESLQRSVPDLFRPTDGTEPRHTRHIEEMLRDLPVEKQEFVARHVSGFVALLCLK